MKLKTIFLFLSLTLWIFSSPISDCCFPTTSTEDINKYWELKKIIYSVCIILIILSSEYSNRFKKLVSLIFIGILAEDISDRIEGITYFQYSDLIILDLIVVSSIYIIYEKEVKKIINRCCQQ